MIALLKVLADPSNQLPAITFWLLDSLASISPGDLGVAAPLTLLGLLPSHSGRILLQNDSIEALSRSEIARRIGYVPQGHAAYFAFKRNLHPLLEP